MQDKSSCARDLIDGLNLEDNFCDRTDTTTCSDVKGSLLSGDAVYIVRLNTTPIATNVVAADVGSVEVCGLTAPSSPQIDNEVSGHSPPASHREPGALSTAKEPQDICDVIVTDQANQSDVSSSVLFI